MKDSFYTPTYLAERLISSVSKDDIFSISDFSIGGGELIKAALKRWPKAKCFGTDISKKALKKLQKQYDNWVLSQCDFLNDRSRKRSRALSQIGDGIDLILLNPPFSCVGGTRHKVLLDNSEFTVSTAMAFVVEAMKYMSKNGCIYAILPNSVAYSQKDEKIWRILQQKYHLKIIEETSFHHFEQTSSKVLLVTINCKEAIPITRRMQNRVKMDALEVFRGKLSMHKLVHNSRARYYFVHSTNLRDNAIEGLKYKCNHTSSKISGPALLIPRVGLPDPKKIVAVKVGQNYVLSDCILAVKAESEAKIKMLKEHFLRNWKDIEAMYKGTGAHYLTVENLKKYLSISKSESVRNPNMNLTYPSVNLVAI